MRYFNDPKDRLWLALVPQRINVVLGNIMLIMESIKVPK
jgi:hypothetical protein